MQQNNQPRALIIAQQLMIMVQSSGMFTPHYSKHRMNQILQTIVRLCASVRKTHGKQSQAGKSALKLINIAQAHAQDMRWARNTNRHQNTCPCGTCM